METELTDLSWMESGLWGGRWRGRGRGETHISCRVTRPSLSSSPGVDWLRARAAEDGHETVTDITRLTFLQGNLLVSLYLLGSHGLQPDPGGRVVLEHVPHVLLAEDKQVAVANRADTGRPSVACNMSVSCRSASPPLTCSAHVQNGNFSEVRASFQGCQHSFTVSIDNL